MTSRYAKYHIMLPKFFSPLVPAVQRQFNKNIQDGFRLAGEIANFGLLPLDKISPRCGLCSLVCVADPRQLRELFELLRSSGKVYLDRQGREVVRKVDASGRTSEYVPPQEQH